MAEGEEYVFQTFDQSVYHEQDEVLRVVKKWVKGDPPNTKEEIKGLPQDVPSQRSRK